LNIVFQFDPVSVLHVYQMVIIVYGQDEFGIAYPSHFRVSDQMLLAFNIDQHCQVCSLMLHTLVYQLLVTLFLFVVTTVLLFIMGHHIRISDDLYFNLSPSLTYQ
jgi:hypothetical protein